MVPEVPVAIDSAGGHIEFRFEEPVSIFMFVVSRDDEVVWELLAEKGESLEGGVLSVTSLEQATPQMLEIVQRAEDNFVRRMREGAPPTRPVSRVRYGVAPQGYRERSPAKKLAPGRYDVTAMCAQGQATGEFDVPAA